MRKILFVATILLMTACSKKENSSGNVAGNTGQNNSGADTLLSAINLEVDQQRPVYRSTETVLTDLIHTKLEVNFDWQKSRMNGIATITAKPHFYASDSLILDAKGMDIKKVQSEGKDLTYSYDSSYLRIKLSKIYSRNDKYTVVINYVAKPDERQTGGSAAITSDKGLYFINPKGDEKFKMPQIWTQGETEANSVWFPTILVQMDQKWR